MDRTKLIESILGSRNINPKDALAESLRYMNDTSLLALAITLGVQIETMEVIS